MEEELFKNCELKGYIRSYGNELIFRKRINFKNGFSFLIRIKSQDEK